MVRAANFEALKWSYRQCKDGIVVSFLVQPHDINAQLATAPLGTRYMVAFAEIGDDEKPVVQPNPEPAGKEKPRTPWHELKPSQQAGIRCNDPEFIIWAGQNDEYAAAVWVRLECGVSSRNELDNNPNAAVKWDALDHRFLVETGKIAEER